MNANLQPARDLSEGEMRERLARGLDDAARFYDEGGHSSVAAEMRRKASLLRSNTPKDKANG